tara:strand:+ start:157 stop:840 length:684 start_codon:yes stop_codon:yes gene_type:complete
MKKYVYLLVALFGLTSAVNANGINVGVSLTGGVFDADGTEKFSGAHVSGGSPGTVTKKTSTEGDDAETLFAYGSLFIEKEINDTIAVGFDYVPQSLDSETTENTQKTTTSSATGTNKVSVSFENMMTAYVTARSPAGVYAKVGYVEVDVATNEVLATGSKYPDTSLEGFLIGVGYDMDLDNGMFARVEANMMEFDDVSVKSTVDATKSIEASGIEGYGARVSIGKSF